MSSGGGGTQTSTTVEKSDPWVGIQPYLLQIAQEAGGTPASAGYYNPYTGTFTGGSAGSPGILKPREYYPGQTVTPFSSYTNEYINSSYNKARNDPTYNAANASLMGTLNGDYLTSNPAFDYLGRQARGEFLNSNPYRDAAFGSASDAVRGEVDSAFGRSGRSNSGAYQAVLQKGLGNLANQFYFDDYARERGAMDAAGTTLGNLYANERGNMTSALGLAPSVDKMGWDNVDRLNTLGQLVEGKQGQYIEDAMNRWNFAQNEPYQYLSDKAQIIQGIGGDYAGRSSTGTMPAPKQNNAAAYAGTALALIGALAAI